MASLSAEERTALRDAVTRLLADHSTEADVRRTMETAQGYDEKLWSQLAEMGVAGLVIDEAYGGAGAGPLELEAVMEAAGAGLMVIGSVAGMAKKSMGEMAFVAVAIAAVGNAAGRIIAGVCVGLARRFGWSVFVVRMLFLLSLGLLGLAHALIGRVGLAVALGCPALLVVAVHQSMSIC